MAGNSVAQAIVTLVPKFNDNALGAMETQLGKSGKTGGAKFAGALKGFLAAGAVMEVGKLAGEIFGDAFNAAAEFEQLSGGVEKIFSGMDTSAIFADAKNAYKDLNMSANDYLAKVNDVGASFKQTMGDEKGYATARKGMKAISDYASGTGKSMDVLQEKFGMITRATSSYQSIADQFSGLLPATSKDFLEQAQAAGFLSDKYKKLTDVPIDEYQQAVADMLEKGTQDMGLYGNTASETEHTVSGSLAALKASWDNLLTAMGTGEDVEGAANQIVDSFITALQNIIPLAAQVIVGMGGALLSALGNLLTSGVNAIANKYGEFEQGARNLIDGMIQGLANNAWAVVEKIKEICAGALDAVKSFFGIASPSKVMRRMFGYVGEGMALGLDDSKGIVYRSMDSLLDSAYGKAATFGVGLNARINGNGRATNADVVGAINMLHNDLGAIIKNNTPDGMTSRQFGRAVRVYA